MKASKQQIQSTSRLTTQAAFDSLRKTKIRWVSQGFALQALPQETDNISYCVIASKKTAKLAVDRNRMRRRLRAVALEILPSCAKNEMIYMIVARGPSTTRDMDELRRDMRWCLRKLDLLSETSNANEHRTDSH